MQKDNSSFSAHYTYAYYTSFDVMTIYRISDMLDLQLPMQSVPITTDVMTSNINQGEVYNIMW